MDYYMSYDDRRRAFWRRITLFTALAVGLCAIVLIVIISTYSRGLPDHRHLADYKPQTTTRIYASDGEFMSEYAYEKRVFVPIEDIPRRVIDAFIATEDQNFWSHPGVDVFSMVRAAIGNIQRYRDNRRPQGGSTITQQVAKNFLLSNELSLERKIKEALLALRIEETLSKERILELYLNEIYLGLSAYGVASAAQIYFGKTLGELTLPEAAFLAGLPKAPSTYHPIRHPLRAIERRNWALGRMEDEGMISSTEYHIATKQPLNTLSKKQENLDTHYFSEEVRQELVTRYDEKTLYSGGLSVYTSLDPHLQDIAHRSLIDGLEYFDQKLGYRGPIAHLAVLNDWQKQLTAIDHPSGAHLLDMAVVLSTTRDNARIGLSHGGEGMIALEDTTWAHESTDDNSEPPPPHNEVTAMADVLRRGDVILVEKKDKESTDTQTPRYLLQQIPEVNGAIIVINPHDGSILAMSGGYSWEASKFNRATQAKRQPGSAFKPIVYLAALDNGFSPTSKILDAPFVFRQSKEDADWKPQNYSKEFYGLTLLRQGLEKSRNLITLRLANAIGLEPIADYATTLGVNDTFPTDDLAAVLGTRETTLLQLTKAYAPFVNGGKKIEAHLIDRIQDQHGKTIYKKDTRSCPECQTEAWTPFMRPPYPDNVREQIIEPALAYQMLSLLEGVVRRGTAYYIGRIIKHAIAGKTGTTNDHKDTWFIGFSPDLLVGVYTGYDVPRSLGEQGTGAGAAGPTFALFMNEALQGTPMYPFRIPTGVRLVSIDRESGLPTDPGSKGAIFEAFRADQFTEEGQTQATHSTSHIDIADPVINADPILDNEPTGLY